MGTTSRKRITLKIIFSYAVLALLALVASFYIYKEVKCYLKSDGLNDTDQKLLMTNSFLSKIYETENLSKRVQQQNSQEHFSNYSKKMESLKAAMDSLKISTQSELQVEVLDSIAFLLQEKADNSRELAKIREKQTRKKPFDSLMEGFEKIEQSMGRITPESFAPNYYQLSTETQKTIREYVALLNENIPEDPNTEANQKKMDSVLIASKALLLKAKQESISFEKGLAQQEMNLFRTDLALSGKLQLMIRHIEKEVTANSLKNEALKRQAMTKSIRLAGATAILALMTVAIFTFLIKRDFFKMQQLKNRLEQEKKFSDSLLKSREQLITTVSHDLRTPLSSIKGYAELLENTPNHNKRKAYLKSVRSASQYVEQLVNDLLDYSQIEAGKITIQKQAFSLKQLVEEIESEYRQLYVQKGILMSFEIDSIFDRPIFSDPIRLKQILGNLLGNALKFTKVGEVTIKASVYNKKLLIVVKDTGIGIEQQYLDRIFEEFSQAAGTHTEQKSGYGLGLTISKKLAHLLDGDITVASKKGKGSSFSVLLPLDFSEKPISKNAANPILTGTVLVIDDDITLANLIAEICKQYHYKALVFDDFSQVPKSKPLAYDLVLTDIQMPIVDGFGVLNSLKAGRHTHYKGQPIIAMTGDRTHSEDMYLKSGFADVLKKPFTPAQLLQKFRFNTAIDIYDERPQKVIKKVTCSTTSASASFDLDTINHFLDNDQKAVDRVLRAFLEDTSENVRMLKKAINGHDLDTISKIAHRMLPMIKQLQAKKTVAILEALEKWDNEPSKEELQTKWTVLKEEVEHIQHRMELHLNHDLSL